MTGFSVSIREADDVIPALAKGIRHWKAGYSAMELASAWLAGPAVPQRVQSWLSATEEYRGAELLEGWFERSTDLPGRGAPSQTDLLLLLRSGDDAAVVAVEGKVSEPFGPLVGDWLKDRGENDPSDRQQTPSNRGTRLSGLCELLGLDQGLAKALRYQLLHRTCAAILEAKRFRARYATMLVHSFSGIGAAEPASFSDFSQFGSALGFSDVALDVPSGRRDIGGVSLRLGWVSDAPAPAKAEFTIRDFLLAWGKSQTFPHGTARWKRSVVNLDRLAGLFGLDADWYNQPGRLPHALEDIVRRAADSYDWRATVLEYEFHRGERAHWERHAPKIETAAHRLRRSYLDFAEALFLAVRPNLRGRTVALDNLRAQGIDLDVFENVRGPDEDSFG